LIKRLISLVYVSSLLAACGGSSGSSSDSEPALTSKSALGEVLFSDVNLSFERTQSCATCHNPQHGFVDDRSNDASTGGLTSPVSLGDNGTSLGDRNAPTAAYAAFSPDFQQGTRERVASQKTSGIGDYNGYLGGQFWDGRSIDLTAQAGGPPTNPIEMGMPNKAAVVERLRENSRYINAFEVLYGADVFNDVDTAYEAMADSIAAFEEQNKAQFYPFDSKYDGSLTGEYQYEPGTPAALGRALFFSSDFSCAACHQLRPLSDKGEIFTSFEYHNIGVPENTALRAINGETSVDKGLANNSAVPDAEKAVQEGKFKVPTLRNTAVTAPYMHNGVFNELETVMLFYEHAKKRGQNQADNSLNPETGLPWRTPEIDKNISHGLLGGNDIVIDDVRAKAFSCFMLTLTDAKYEYLLDPQKVTECGI